MTELYLKYRPETFKDINGQADALKLLGQMGKRGEIPHVLLFTGPSGCGKTTLARILRRKLKCSDLDFQELNAANSRGIDMVRDLQLRSGSAPMAGNCRVWIIDEVHQLTSAAQDAILKLLEDTPRHAYFFLATTDPQKLKKTIITRCTEIRCKALSDEAIQDVLRRVIGEEGGSVHKDVVGKIVQASEGSARKALVILHKVIGSEDTEEQLRLVESANVQATAIEIARLLFKSGVKWKSIADVLERIDKNEDAEAIRYVVLGYARKVLLNGNPRGAEVIEAFRDNFYDSKMAGLALACWEANR